MQTFLRYFHTLRHLKPIQVRYQFYYLLRRKWRKLVHFTYKMDSPTPASAFLKMRPSIPSKLSWQENEQFRFLNLSHEFEGNIDWNYAKYGKLWTYNLNYFEYLEQPYMGKAAGLRLIHDHLANWGKLRDGLEPFPISVSSIYWIKFIRNK